jgi:hypothetical protein
MGENVSTISRSVASYRRRCVLRSIANWQKRQRLCVYHVYLNPKARKAPHHHRLSVFASSVARAPRFSLLGSASAVAQGASPQFPGELVGSSSSWLVVGEDSRFLIRSAARRNSAVLPGLKPNCEFEKRVREIPTDFFLRLLSRHFYPRVAIVPTIRTIFSLTRRVVVDT